MSDMPKPPKTFRAYVERYPHLGEAWDRIRQAEGDGPLDARTVRLIKLGVAMGALREGAVHAGVRKAVALGIPREDIEQVVALVAGTLGMPASVACFSWVRDVLDKG